jgi:hypothetical protein
MHATDDLDFVKLEKIALKTGEICPIPDSSSSSFFPSLCSLHLMLLQKISRVLLGVRTLCIHTSTVRISSFNRKKASGAELNRRIELA